MRSGHRCHCPQVGVPTPGLLKLLKLLTMFARAVILNENYIYAFRIGKNINVIEKLGFCWQVIEAVV